MFGFHIMDVVTLISMRLRLRPALTDHSFLQLVKLSSYPHRAYLDAYTAGLAVSVYAVSIALAVRCDP